MRRLPDTSRFYALARGGWELQGWGEDRLLAACQFNLTLAAHGGDKKHQWVIPTSKTKKPAKPRTVKEIFYGLPTGGQRL